MKEQVKKGDLPPDALVGERFYKAEQQGVDLEDQEKVNQLLRLSVKDRWSCEEISKWTQLILKHGKNYKLIAKFIGTKDEGQCVRKG